jgi:hypothetical protein
MAAHSFDPLATASGALQQIVAESGPQALGAPDLLDEKLGELLPENQLAMERALLVAASGAGVDRDLNERVAHGADPEDAIGLAATRLHEATPFDADGCVWATRQFALALGLDVPTAAHAEDDGWGEVIPDQSEKVRNPKLIGIGAALIVIVVAVIVAAVAGLGPFSKSTNGTGSATGTSTTDPKSVDPALLQYMPQEAAQCGTVEPGHGLPTGLVGLFDATSCNLPKLGAQSYLTAFLFDDASDYKKSLSAYNKEYDFAPTPGVGCPTTNSKDVGSVQWSDGNFPTRSGQVIECSLATVKGEKGLAPTYVWTVPTNHIILVATGDPGSSMQSLDTWWTNLADT